MSSPTDRSVDATEVEFAFSRVFDVPRALVFKAWTEADALAQWWAPKGATVQVKKLELWPGGIFLYAQKFANGPELWGKFVYHEILPPERLVYVNSFTDAEGNIVRNPWSTDWPLELLNTLTFAEQDGRTTLSSRTVPLNATEVERQTFAAARGGLQQGIGGTLDQLDAFLARR